MLVSSVSLSATALREHLNNFQGVGSDATVGVLENCLGPMALLARLRNRRTMGFRMSLLQLLDDLLRRRSSLARIL
jgi:hypothetical protein